MLRRFVMLLMVLSLTGCALFQRPAPQPRPVPPAPVQPKAEPKQEEATAERYFPAALGSVWQYQGVGNEFAQFTRTVTYGAGNRVQIEDASGAIVASVFVITPNEIRRVHRVAEMDPRRNILNERETLSEVILRSPFAPGQTWKNGNITFLVEATDQITTVPAGTYRNVVVVRVTQPGSTWTTKDYYAPGVGLVRRDSISGTDTISSLLEKYVPGK